MFLKKEEGQDARREPSKKRKQHPLKAEGSTELEEGQEDEALQNLSVRKQEQGRKRDNPGWCCWSR